MISLPFQNWMTDAQTEKLIDAARETCTFLRRSVAAGAAAV